MMVSVASFNTNFVGRKEKLEKGKKNEVHKQAGKGGMIPTNGRWRRTRMINYRKFHNVSMYMES